MTLGPALVAFLLAIPAAASAPAPATVLEVLKRHDP